MSNKNIGGICMAVNLHFNKPSAPIHISHRYRDTMNVMTQYHAHDEHYEVYYLIKGKRKYFIKDKTYYVNEGDIVFINKGDLHRTFYVDDFEHERLLINFRADFLNCEYGSYAYLLDLVFQQPIIIQLKFKEKQRFEDILYSMVNEVQKDDEGQELYLKTLLVQLLINSVRHLANNNADSQEYTGNVYNKVTEIIHYINEHYDDDSISLESISDTFYISPYYLSRIFKNVTGFTYTEYLNHVRIQKAQRMLKESNLKVIDIAGKVGFNSLTHFGRVFKNNTRYTPSAYRKIHKV